MNKALKITLIIIASLIVAIISMFFKNDNTRFIVYVFLFRPIIHFVIFPFVVYYKFFHILYPAMLGTIAVFPILFLLIKRFANFKRYQIILVATITSQITLYSISEFIAESHIKKFALQRYNQPAQEVNLNLSAWYTPGDIIHGDRYLGKAHAYIFRDGCKSNWSFVKNDFVKPWHCQKRVNKARNGRQ